VGSAIGKIPNTRIADELHHPSVLRQDGAGAALEVAIQQGEERVDRQRFRQLGRVAQVAVPQHGAHGAAVATLDLAAQHLLAGLAAEVGAQHVMGDLVLDRDLAGDREAALDAQQDPDVLLAEAGLVIGGPGAQDAIHALVHERPDEAQIVGGSVVAQLGQDREIQQRVGAGQPPPQVGHARAQHPMVRTALERRRGLGLALVVALRDQRPVPAPDVGDGGEQRMQGAVADQDPVQWDARRPQPPAAALDQTLHAGVAERLGHQPIGGGVDQSAGSVGVLWRHGEVLLCERANMPRGVTKCERLRPC
jgi:hypothetical protein